MSRATRTFILVALLMAGIFFIVVLVEIALTLSETGKISLFNTLLISLSGLGVALIARQGTVRHNEAKQDREALAAKTDAVAAELAQKTDAVAADLKQAVKPENGHDTIGQGIAAIEERLIEGEKRFDRIDYQVGETLAQVNDIRSAQRVTNEALAKHLDEWDPLLEWAEREAARDAKRKRRRGRS